MHVAMQTQRSWTQQIMKENNAGEFWVTLYIFLRKHPAFCFLFQQTFLFAGRLGSGQVNSCIDHCLMKPHFCFWFGGVSIRLDTALITITHDNHTSHNCHVTSHESHYSYSSPAAYIWQLAQNPNACRISSWRASTIWLHQQGNLA